MMVMQLELFIQSLELFHWRVLIYMHRFNASRLVRKMNYTSFF